MAISPDVSTTPKVSQLATAIKLALGELGSGWVEGEVQNLRPAASGHVYFRLADEDAVINCCIWRSRGAASSRRRRRACSCRRTSSASTSTGSRAALHCTSTSCGPPARESCCGASRRRCAGCRREGLTDPSRRRSLPRFPRRIGVIAGHDSDAKVDVIKSLRERFPPAHIVFRPALVEGVRAVDSMIEALIHLQSQPGVDVIVLARGGGGVRELVAFDDVKLCKAIFACDKPVVTSIGHTKQRPNCDHVAAAFADVPARAAELVVPSAAELRAELDRHAAVLGAMGRGDRGPHAAAHRPGREARGCRAAVLPRAPPDPRSRLLNAAGRRARRQCNDFAEAIARRGAEAHKTVMRRLQQASRDVAHAAEVVQAKDFRRRGWLLGSGPTRSPGAVRARPRRGREARPAVPRRARGGHPDRHRNRRRDTMSDAVASVKEVTFEDGYAPAQGDRRAA